MDNRLFLESEVLGPTQPPHEGEEKPNPDPSLKGREEKPHPASPWRGGDLSYDYMMCGADVLLLQDEQVTTCGSRRIDIGVVKGLGVMETS